MPESLTEEYTYGVSENVSLFYQPRAAIISQQPIVMSVTSTHNLQVIYYNLHVNNKFDFKTNIK